MEKNIDYIPQFQTCLHPGNKCLYKLDACYHQQFSLLAFVGTDKLVTEKAGVFSFNNIDWMYSMKNCMIILMSVCSGVNGLQSLHVSSRASRRSTFPTRHIERSFYVIIKMVETARGRLVTRYGIINRSTGCPRYGNFAILIPTTCNSILRTYFARRVAAETNSYSKYCTY